MFVCKMRSTKFSCFFFNPFVDGITWMVSMGSDWQILQKMDLWLQESRHFEDKPGTSVVGYTLWLFNIAMENGSSIDDKNDDYSVYIFKMVISHTWKYQEVFPMIVGTSWWYLPLDWSSLAPSRQLLVYAVPRTEPPVTDHRCYYVFSISYS